MAYFSLDNNQDFIFGNNSNIECIKCCEQKQKYIRCSCCNDVITLNDIMKHITNISNNNVKLVRLSGVLCLKLHVKDIYNISKFFIHPDVNTMAVNFEYNTNYIENKTNDGQIIRGIQNIEFVKQLSNFKETSINVKYLLMNNSINNEAEVLINVNNLNVLLPANQ